MSNLKGEPSPIMSSSLPVYGSWRERAVRSLVTWWEAPLSDNQEKSMVGEVAMVMVSALQ